VRVLHPRDRLPGLVAVAVAYSYVSAQMSPMDADSMIPSSDLDQHHRLSKGVGLTLGVLGKNTQPVFSVLLRPVAGLAGLPRRTKVVHRRGNRPRIIIERDGHHLSDAR